MKFVTEEELRDRYKKQPFTDYELTPDTRLTPGAREFLTGLRINLRGDAIPAQGRAAADKASGNRNSEALRQAKQFADRLKSAESVFLLTCRELLDRDVILAREAMNLERQLAAIRAAAEGRGRLEEVGCRGCAGIKPEHFGTDAGDCFEISEFHMMLEKGTEILKLHRLRCALREAADYAPDYAPGSNADFTALDSDSPEASAEGGNDNELYTEIIARINIIINSLSQMICTAVGGKTCQRIK